MPVIRFEGRDLECASGETLRDALHRHGESPHNRLSRSLHCMGLGSCGTCAVAVEGDTHPLTALERWRLSFPPHRRDSDLRLACQLRVERDLVVRKHGGFWGHRVGEPREP